MSSESENDTVNSQFKTRHHFFSVYIAAVIMLEAGPVYRIFMSGIFDQRLPVSGWLWIISSFGLATLISILTVIFSMKYGERNLRKLSRRVQQN
jgi:hypothetical protein